MKILFQGDSVTDMGRNRNNDGSFGQGYPFMVAGALGYRQPGCHCFFNRGISGNRVVDVYARAKADIWNLQPDLMSLLIGINDVWHEISYQNGVDALRYEKVYRMLLEDSQKACPGMKIMLMEPFVLPGTATSENWDYFSSETEKRTEIVRRLAAEFRLPFVPLQEPLNQACQKAPADYWLVDGVHPTVFGHQLIADAWLQVFDREISHCR